MGNARQDAAHNSPNDRDFRGVYSHCGFLDLDYNASLNLVKHFIRTLSQISLDMAVLLTDVKTSQLITNQKLRNQQKSHAFSL